MSLFLANSPVSTEWLAVHLDDPDLATPSATEDGVWTEWGQPGDTPVDTNAETRGGRQ